MMKNETKTDKQARCYHCKRAYTLKANEADQYDFEYNGFCSWECQADFNEACIRYERYYKP